MSDNNSKKKKSARKRGDSWERRITLCHNQYSIYDIDERRLESRVKEIKEKFKILLGIENSYRLITPTVEFLNEEYNTGKLREAEEIYNKLLLLINQVETKLTVLVTEVYNRILELSNSLSKTETQVEEIKEESIVTVKEWFYKWLWTYKYGHKAKTTFRGYVSKTKNHIIRVFGDRNLSDVTTLEIQTFINDLMLDYKPSTIKQIFLLLQEGFARAVKDKIIEQTPVIDIETPEVIPNTMMSVDLEVEKQLISIFKDDEMCYPFAVLIDTGLRTSELCGIKWKNVDFDNRRIFISQSYQRVDEFDFVNGEIIKIGSSLEETPLKSRTSKREIPMSKGVYNILKEIYNDTLERGVRVNKNDFVFINKRGNPIVGECLRNRLEDLLTKYGLKGISLHRFRHTFATRLYEAKVALKNIQNLLGHATVQMTERYLHIDKEQQEASIEQLENYYEKVGIQICS